MECNTYVVIINASDKHCVSYEIKPES